MRKLLHWFFRGVMGLLLLLSLLLLAAWPVSYLGTAQLHHRANGGPLDLAPQAQHGTSYQLALVDARVVLQWIKESPEVIDPLNPPDLSPPLPVSNRRSPWSVDWLGYRPIAEPAFSWRSAPTLGFVVIPIWAIALVPLLPPLIWFLFGIDQLFYRKVRVRSAYCLHCGHQMQTHDLAKCPDCGKARSLVTVSQRETV